MIRIETIEINEFRGIRKLTIQVARKNFGICGPNGTGKSGVVDALEFALTGDITRLSGSGSGDVSVKTHGPHVDSRKTPEKSFVTITAFATALNRQIKMTRRMKTATVPELSPADTKVQALAAQLAIHPEFALSRREIVKYIITPPGQRSKDVQTLLKLDQIEKVRQSLQKLANETKKESLSATTEDEQAKKNLLKHLGINVLSKAELLTAVNARRKVLNLDPIVELTLETSLKGGVAASDDTKQKPKQKLSKNTAVADMSLFDQDIAAAEAINLVQFRASALAILKDLQGNPQLLRSFKRQVLVQQGLELLEDGLCPLCETAWDIDTLRTHLQQKLIEAQETSDLLKELSEAAKPVSMNLQSIALAADKLIAMCALSEPKIEPAALAAYSNSCKAARKPLESVCTDPSFIDEALKVLSGDNWKVPSAASDVVDLLQKYIDVLPEPSKTEQAQEFLIVAQERYDRCRATKATMDQVSKRSGVAAKVLQTYGITSNAVLEGIYDAVQKDFTEYYRLINHDDEEKFDGKLTPSVGKLAFDVDFYGRGKFPPGAYHSEGHQDGMGLCLYLALMKHTLGKDFTFAVLDDVLMSVDAGHRREVCKLLKTKFPQTQFIITTHDPVWLQFMRTENLINSSISFSGWTVDAGPQVWDDSDVWGDIEAKLGKGDISGAAATLRRYLEFVSTVLADNFRAEVEYRGDGQYELGDLLPPTVHAWKALIRDAREATASWGQNTVAIEKFAADAKDKISKSSIEQWMINKAVHYNAWANLQPQEFGAVVSAFKDLLKSMQCPNAECAEFVYVSPRKGKKETLRCGCGAVNFNLTAKGK